MNTESDEKRSLASLPMVVQRSLIALESIRRVLADYDTTHPDLFHPVDLAMREIDDLFEDGCGPYGATDHFNADPTLKKQIEALINTRQDIDERRTRYVNPDAIDPAYHPYGCQCKNCREPK